MCMYDMYVTKVHFIYVTLFYGKFDLAYNNTL